MQGKEWLDEALTVLKEARATSMIQRASTEEFTTLTLLKCTDRRGGGRKAGLANLELPLRAAECGVIPSVPILVLVLALPDQAVKKRHHPRRPLPSHSQAVIQRACAHLPPRRLGVAGSASSRRAARRSATCAAGLRDLCVEAAIAAYASSVHGIESLAVTGSCGGLRAFFQINC